MSWTKTVCINNVKLKFEIDTRAACSISVKALRIILYVQVS
jgi:hypothetical protein